MPEPFLHLRDIGFVRERVGSRGGPERMDAQAVHLGVDAGSKAVVPHDVAVDGSGIERPVQLLWRAIVPAGRQRGPKGSIP